MINNVKMEQKLNRITEVEAYSVCPTCTKPLVVCSTSLHDVIVKNIISLKPIIKKVNVKKFLSYYDNSSINFVTREIEIQVCKSEINWIKEGKCYFSSRCFVDIEHIIEVLNITGDYIDAYGTILVGNELLLNNYDAVFEEESKNEKGFCDVLGFATINKNGIVRFTQIVYSFLFKKLIIRDNVTYKLPFKPNLKKDFGGKRATYRYHSILSIRTTPSVYKKIDKKYWQSEIEKDSLSYPRLKLS